MSYVLKLFLHSHIYKELVFVQCCPSWNEWGSFYFVSLRSELWSRKSGKHLRKTRLMNNVSSLTSCQPTAAGLDTVSYLFCNHSVGEVSWVNDAHYLQKTTVSAHGNLPRCELRDSCYVPNWGCFSLSSNWKIAVEKPELLLLKDRVNKGQKSQSYNETLLHRLLPKPNQKSFSQNWLFLS